MLNQLSPCFQDKLGPALTMVYSKANSVIINEVEAPSWLHRFIIGKKGASIQKITQDLPKVGVIEISLKSLYSTIIQTAIL